MINRSPVTNRPQLGAGPLVYVGGRVLSQAFEFALWVVAVNVLALGDAGVLALALLGARYAGFLADWGATFNGSREVARHGSNNSGISGLIRRREASTAWACVLFTAGILALGVPEMLPLLGSVLHRGLNRDWMALGAGRQTSAVWPNLAAQASALTLGLALDPRWLPAAYGLGGVLGLAVSLGLNRRPGSAPGHSTITGGAWYVVAGMAGLVYTTADTFLLGVLRTSSEVAVYSSVYRLPNAWLLIVGLFVAALVPRVSACPIEAAPALRERLIQGGVAATVVVLVATPPALALAPSLFGTEFMSGQAPLAVLMVAAAVTTAGAPFQVLVIAAGFDQRAAVPMVVAALFNLAANLIAIPRFGMLGAATTTLASQSMPALYYWHISRRKPA